MKLGKWYLLIVGLCALFLSQIPPKNTQTKKVEEPKVVIKKEKPIQMTATLPAREVSLYKEVELICTFYTNLPSEGGRLDSKGQPLSRGAIASNHLKYGTVIQTGEFGTLRVVDTGSSKHFWYIDDNTYRIDIFVQRKSNESDTEYKQRVKDMGVQTIKGKILNNMENPIDLNKLP